MENTAKTKCYSYFAAANGYSGFRSYFNGAFSPTNYLRLFILKGGPGTGKNTLMRGIHEKFSNNVESSELIYCSSDTSSLDGVILRSKKGQIAIIDGTAPHATDPKYPGCIDEMVNLGDFWHTEKLVENRAHIESLTRKKSEAYRRAYTFLNLAGHCDEAIEDIILSAYKDTDLVCTKNTHTNGYRLIDAFGKDGLFELDTLNHIAKKTIGVVGLWGSDQIYIGRLARGYSADDIIEFPSALSENKIKAVYIKSEDTAYIANPGDGANYSTTLDVSDLLDHRIIKENTDCLERLSGVKESLLWNSRDEFKNASDAHFKLEDIYKSSVDFSLYDRLIENLYEKIESILF